jgi:F-type H+-transporting ATPase subunit b
MKALFVLLAAEGHKPPPLVDLDGTAFVQFGIFVILLFFLTKLVFRPYLALLRERHENIEGAKKEAEGVNTQADDKLNSYEDQIARARKEAAAVRLELREKGESHANTILAKARTDSEAKVQAARNKIEKSSQAAKLALRTRADQIAKSIVTKLLGREV